MAPLADAQDNGEASQSRQRLEAMPKAISKGMASGGNAEYGQTRQPRQGGFVRRGAIDLCRGSLGIVGVALGLGGCAVYPAGYAYNNVDSYGYSSKTVVTVPIVRYAPPAPRVEVIAPTPFPGAVWIGGNWIWRDRWVWKPGHWVRPPRPHAQWVPGRWEQERGHTQSWRWHRGRWH